MKYLCFDTVNERVTLEISGRDQNFRWSGPARSYSSILVKEIQNYLTISNFKMSDLEIIIFNRGPGSFTGIKQGVILAQSLSHNLDVKVKSFTSFDLMYLACYRDKHRVYVINAWQGDYFCARRTDSGFDIRICKEIPWDDPVTYLGSEDFIRSGWDYLDIDLFRYPAFLWKEHFDLLSDDLSPFYLKKSAAQINLEEKSRICFAEQ